MPRQLLIDDHIEMRADALHRSNMDGPWQETKVHFKDEFTNGTLDTNVWTSTAAGAAATNAINVGVHVGGVVRLLTSTTDNASQMISTSLIWEDDKYAVCEARINLADVSGTALFFGFTDATSETTPDMAIHYPDDVLTTVATNAVGFVVDADHASSSIMCCGVNAGTDETPVDTGTDWADAEWHTLRIELDPDGNAIFWLDGVAKARLATAIASGTDLAVAVHAATRAADGANNVYADYVEAWQNR